ncbi:hypothetical protein, partial [Pseudomonas sp. PS01298]|uniref:hypothetical protein n=1 Tax=Pseudomonas sp. PS01298 TaxID=2991434 RepID=UPI002499B847
MYRLVMGSWVSCDKHGVMAIKFCDVEQAYCGEQACPALGCAAAPKPDWSFSQINCGGLIGAAA